jgi:hypothetical protein
MHKSMDEKTKLHFSEMRIFGEISITSASSIHFLMFFRNFVAI